MNFLSRSSPESHRRDVNDTNSLKLPLFSIVRASIADSILFIVPANTNFPLFEGFVSNYRLRVHDSDAAEKKKAIFESEINHCNLNLRWLDGSHKSHTRVHPARSAENQCQCLAETL